MFVSLKKSKRNQNLAVESSLDSDDNSFPGKSAQIPPTPHTYSRAPTLLAAWTRGTSGRAARLAAIVNEKKKQRRREEKSDVTGGRKAEALRTKTEGMERKNWIISIEDLEV